MCGIYATNTLSCKDKDIIKNVKKNQRLLNHRGPDCYYTIEKDNVFLAHHRLAIIDISSEANQPFKSKNNNYLTINGEIYNYNQIYEDINKSTKQKINKTSNSDCESVLHLYEFIKNYNNDSDNNDNNDNEHKINNNLNHTDIKNMLNKLDGIFSFVIYDSNSKNLLIARDPFGVTSLYYGFDKEGYIHVASEIKAFTDNEIVPYMFPAGSYCYYSVNGDDDFEILEYYSYLTDIKQKLNNGEVINNERPYNITKENIINRDDIILDLADELKKILIESVAKRLQSNVPFAILLSGGLDSSLICMIAVKLLTGQLFGKDELLDIYNVKKVKKASDIHTFSIGFEGSPDLQAAQVVAQFLGTTHHSITITMEEALLAIPDVMWHLETYDVTTIRASTPMFLLSKKIKALGFKMVLSGEGSDELLGGYLHFHKAPNNIEFTKERISKVENLQYFDNLRANKSTLAWGIEGRFPFLDKKFAEFSLKLPMDVNIYDGIEKYLLRFAFSSKYNELDKNQYLSDSDFKFTIPSEIPESILWRQKEQFSDGVGYQWIDNLRQIANREVTDLMMKNAKLYFKYNTPVTKEEYYYRVMFREIFKNHDFEYCVKKWIPNKNWANVGYDPSGRAQELHSNFNNTIDN